MAPGCRRACRCLTREGLRGEGGAASCWGRHQEGLLLRRKHRVHVAMLGACGGEHPALREHTHPQRCRAVRGLHCHLCGTEEPMRTRRPPSPQKCCGASWIFWNVVVGQGWAWSTQQQPQYGAAGPSCRQCLPGSVPVAEPRGLSPGPTRALVQGRGEGGSSGSAVARGSHPVVQGMRAHEGDVRASGLHGADRCELSANQQKSTDLRQRRS